MLGLVVGTPYDVVGQHRAVIRDDQIVLIICPEAFDISPRLGAPRQFVTKGFAQPYEVLRCAASPSGVSVRTECIRTRFNCGAVRFRQHAVSALFFNPSRFV